MLLQTLLAVFPQHGNIRPCLGKVQVHLLPEELEGLQLIYGILRRVYRVEHNEGLTSALDTLLRNDLHDGAELDKYLAESLDQGRDLDAVVEVLDLKQVSVLRTAVVAFVSYIDPI